ncbi:MAG: DUF3010 family protein [Desulfobulbaceae bacterium]|nr:DUF3010 family protein [Desulfobulbaceae bacterium]HIJ78919.1 DUF3010 family protein [Deltaproteobacteria bacterium]
MKALGIEFSSNKLIYLLVEKHAGGLSVLASGKLELAATRDRDAIVAFQTALIAVYKATAPEVIGMKAKPEKGQMSAGAAALKMEAISLACSPCPVHFLSGAKINGCEAPEEGMKKYQIPALKSAILALALAS